MKNTQLNITISEQTLDKIDHYLADGKFLTRGEAIRYCINTMFEKDYPDYVRLAKHREAKQQKATEEQQAFINMGAHEYAMTVLKAAEVVQNADGADMAVFKNAAYPNMTMQLPLSKVKDYRPEDIIKLWEE